MNIKEGYVTFKGYRTYYRGVNLESSKTPLILLHGGPGGTHNSYELFDELAIKDDRPIIMYDQLGCGLSSLDSPHPNLWKKETWVDELINLRKELGLTKCHILGHSWGGMLAIIYLCDNQVEGIKSLTLSSTLSSVKLWHSEANRLIKYLSSVDQEAIKKAEESKDYETLEFKIAMNDYYKKYVSDVDKSKEDTPECLKREKVFGKEAYETAWGKSEFTPSGTLLDYEYTDKLNKINIPTLLISGTDDESTPFQNKVMFDNLGGKKEWVLLENSRHMTYYEQKDKYFEALIKFLNEND